MTYISPVLTQEFTANYGMVLIADQTLLADTASIDIQNIPSGYRVLEIITIIRTTEAVDLSGFNMIFNNDSGANYDAQRLSAVHTTVSGNAAPASSAIVNNAAGANQNAGAVGITRMLIPGYDQNIFHKTVEVYNGNSDDTTTNNRVDVRVNRWKSTAAINRITFTPTGGNFLTGSRVIIYGLGGAPATGVTVPSVFHRHTTGDYLLNNNGAFADIDAANLNLTIPAITGDILEITFSSRWGSENVNAFIDAATIVSGSPVNYVSGGTGSSSNFGVAGWLGLVGLANTFGGSVYYAVQQGDISNGTVTVRLVYRTSAAVVKTLRAGTGSFDALFYAVKNLGH